MNSIRTIATAVALLSATDCNAQLENAVRVVGNVSPGMVSVVSDQITTIKRSGKQPGLLMISYSSGGDAESLLKLVDLANRNVQGVFVSGECLSACAEFLYLVNKRVIAAKNAKIGFHGNALTASRLVRSFNLKGDFNCIDRRAAKSARFLRERGADPTQGANAMLRRLQFYKAIEAPSNLKDGCQNANFFSQFRMWFPTTDQMRSLLGMNIKGPTCSDDEACLKSFASKRWGAKPDVLIGDHPYP